MEITTTSCVPFSRASVLHRSPDVHLELSTDVEKHRNSDSARGSSACRPTDIRGVTLKSCGLQANLTSSLRHSLILSSVALRECQISNKIHESTRLRITCQHVDQHVSHGVERACSLAGGARPTMNFGSRFKHFFTVSHAASTHDFHHLRQTASL